MCALSEGTNKRTHPTSTDSSPVTLPAKRSNRPMMANCPCSLCGLDSGYDSPPTVEGFSLGEQGLAIICDECKACAVGYKALEAKCVFYETKLAATEKALENLQDKFAALELKVNSGCTINETAIANAVARVLAQLLPIHVDQKLDRKFAEFEKRVKESDGIQKNKRCLVVSGFPEKEGSEPDALTAVLNQNLLPVLQVPDRFAVTHSFRMGKPLSDGSPRLVKLIFDTEIARDLVKSSAYNLKDKADFKGIRIRPSLTPAQQTFKKELEEFRIKTYPRSQSGRSPVGFRYEADGSPYLFDFEKKMRVNFSASTGFQRMNSNETF